MHEAPFLLLPLRHEGVVAGLRIINRDFCRPQEKEIKKLWRDFVSDRLRIFAHFKDVYVKGMRASDTCRLCVDEPVSRQIRIFIDYAKLHSDSIQAFYGRNCEGRLGFEWGTKEYFRSRKGKNYFRTQAP